MVLSSGYVFDRWEVANNISVNKKVANYQDWK